MAIFSLFFFFLLHLSSIAATGGCSRKSSPDIPILPLHGSCSPFPSPSTSWFNAVMSMAAKDPARLSSLLASQKNKPTNVPVASGQQTTQTANYVLLAKIGSPGQQLFMAFDTSSDLTWVPCSGCSGCPSSTPFNPSASTTFSSLDCTTAAPPPSTCSFLNQSYGSLSLVASLSHDTLTLGNDTLPNFSFACVTSVSGASGGGTVLPKQGLLGFGRGTTSAMAQSGTLYEGVFSYCLPSFKSYYFSGSLRLGKLGQPKSIKTTPLLKNPRRSSLYYVNMTGISVGKTLLKVDPALLGFDPSTGGGTIVDSGTVITRLVRPLYEALRDEFRRQVAAPEYSSLGAFDTCYNTPAQNPNPAVVLHFDGMDLPLPAENTLIHSSGTPLACLAMAASPDNVNSVLNVIANLQQQNIRVLIDTVNNRVGFARELCN